MAKRFIIAGGGTGGHIFPAVAIANALKQNNADHQILFVGAKGKMEMEKVPQAGYDIKGLDIAGFNRNSLLKNIRLPFKLIKSFFQVREIVNQFKPDAVIGVGGYSSFPVLRYAQAKGIPSFIHESNSFAGKSNILLGKKVTKAFVAIDGMEKFFPKDRLVISGNPVRPSIVKTDNISREEALRFFGLKENKTTVLAVGGSLGARSINEALCNRIEDFEKADIQLIWQTGKTDMAKWKQCAEGKENIWVNDFITQMDMAYAAADIVVSRSGAMAVAELCVVKKPVVFVPYPFAAEDHQTVNASKLVDKNAAVMVKDSNVKEEMVDKLLSLAKDRNQQGILISNIEKLAVQDADQRIVTEILNSI
jgi:UDP-N-acetylglucosamine--N-acetylmuramyl-(pentapeptide) pyrophosphoryl-undecaprenol N-acetylglucosamine transferase